MSANFPDKPTLVIVEPKPEIESEPMEIVPAEITADVAEPKVDIKVSVHAFKTRWSSQKRLKKVHIETLERVYRRSKRPTNTMINIIVQATNLRQKRIVKWFEDKRTEDGALRIPTILF